MKINSTQTFMAPKQCPYTVEGVNLVELRRAKLRKVAQAVKVDPEGPKHELVPRIIAKLKLMDAPKEIAPERESKEPSQRTIQRA